MISAKANDAAGARFLQHLADTMASNNRSQQAWLSRMREAGHACVHPDDGWVDRRANKVTFCYPVLFRRPKVGDTAILGDFRKWRVVRLTSFDPWRYLGGGEDDGEWSFAEEQ